MDAGRRLAPARHHSRTPPPGTTLGCRRRPQRFRWQASYCTTLPHYPVLGASGLGALQQWHADASGGLREGRNAQQKKTGGACATRVHDTDDFFEQRRGKPVAMRPVHSTATDHLHSETVAIIRAHPRGDRPAILPLPPSRNRLARAFALRQIPSFHAKLNSREVRDHTRTLRALSSPDCLPRARMPRWRKGNSSMCVESYCHASGMGFPLPCLASREHPCEHSLRLISAVCVRGFGYCSGRPPYPSLCLLSFSNFFEMVSI